MKLFRAIGCLLLVVLVTTGCSRMEPTDLTAPTGGTGIPTPLAGTGSGFSNPLWEGADPYVIRHDGRYLFTHCDGHNSIYVSESQTLADRGPMTLAYRFPAGQWNSSLVWGPAALFRWEDGRWYMLYCAADGPDLALNNPNHRLGVLRAISDDPLGPYEDLTADAPLNSGGAWAIAAQPFQDFEGNWYIAWSGWENQDSEFPQNTYIAPMENPWTIGDRVMISTPDRIWERSIQPVQEGHMVLRREDRLLMFYSADASWTDNYSLGMLVYSGGDILDPASWVKHPQPVFYRTEKVRGPGGPAIVQSPDGTEDWLLYHAAQWPGSGWRRYVSAVRFTWDASGFPDFGDPVPYGQRMELPSGDPGLLPVDLYDCTWSSDRWFDWTTYGGEWTLSGGGTGRRYVLKGAETTAKSLVRSAVYRDLAMQCTVTLTSREAGTDAGLVFRATQPHVGQNGLHGYYVALDAGSGIVTLYRKTGRRAVELGSGPMTLDRFVEYRIGVEAEGPTIRIFVEDMANPLFEVEDPVYREGAIGVCARGQGADWKQLESRSLD